MSDGLTRRSALILFGTTSATALSGCGYIVGGDDDLVVTNERSSSVTVELEVIDGSDEQLFTETVSLDSDSEWTQDNVLPSSGTVTLSAAVDALSQSEGFEVGEETSLQVAIEDEEITFESTV